MEKNGKELIFMDKNQLVYELHTLATEIQHSDIALTDAIAKLEELLAQLKEENSKADD